MNVYCPKSRERECIMEQFLLQIRLQITSPSSILRTLQLEDSLVLSVVALIESHSGLTQYVPRRHFSFSVLFSICHRRFKALPRIPRKFLASERNDPNLRRIRTPGHVKNFSSHSICCQQRIGPGGGVGGRGCGNPLLPKPNSESGLTTV